MRKKILNLLIVFTALVIIFSYHHLLPQQRHQHRKGQQKNVIIKGTVIDSQKNPSRKLLCSSRNWAGQLKPMNQEILK